MAWGVLLLAAPGVFLALFHALAASPACAADLYLEDEREIYHALDKMNAMGMLPGSLANTRPYDMQAVRAAVDNIAGLYPDDPQSGDPLARWVASYAKQTAIARGTASISWAERRTVPPNNAGVPVPEGISAEFSALGRYEPYSWLSANAKGVVWWGEGGDSDAIFGDSTVEFGHKYISLVAGKIEAWYGPGRRGSLIFTNNAEPFPGVRLHNPVPIPMPWIFSFLGNVQYDLFLAQLDGDRPIKDSRLFGMRLAARPSRYFEIGLSRAIHYGGEGRSNSLSKLWEAFWGYQINQSGNMENELAGFDVEVTLPFKGQPVQLYYEMAAEDQHPRTSNTPFPTPEKWAYLGGVFLPAILGNSSFDLRVEYATNHVYNNGPVWYVHPDYPHEYKGQVLGHPMGNDARDLWIQGHYYLRPSTYLELGLNWTDRYSLGPQVESTFRCTAGIIGWITKSVRTETGFSWENVENPGGTAGPSRTNTVIRTAFSYQAGWGR